MTTTDRSIGISATATNTRESLRTWALVSLVLYLISGVAFAGFSSFGGVWFTISDAVGLLLGIALMVVVIQFDNLFRSEFGSYSRTSRWIGVFAMGLGIAGSIVLLTSQVSHEFVPAEGGLGMQFVGWGLLGIWFLMLASMGSRSGLFSQRWTWAARLTGGGSVVAMALTLPLGPDSPVVSIGFALTFVAIIFWVVWTRKELRVP